MEYKWSITVTHSYDNDNQSFTYKFKNLFFDYHMKDMNLVISDDNYSFSDEWIQVNTKKRIFNFIKVFKYCAKNNINKRYSFKSVCDDLYVYDMRMLSNKTRIKLQIGRDGSLRYHFFYIKESDKNEIVKIFDMILKLMKKGKNNYNDRI